MPAQHGGQNEAASTADDTEETPVGSGSYEVKPGDCILTVADETGFLWETIWRHQDNKDLRTKRKSPSVLMPGDTVAIPERRLRHEQRATGKRHKFVRKGIPVKLRLVVKEEGKAAASQPFTLTIDDDEFSGTTTSSGLIEVYVPTKARTGTLKIGTGADERHYQVDLGDLDPWDSVKGVQARLNNLGMECGAVDGMIGPKTISAIRQFIPSAKHALCVPVPF